jgi:hypothetical protein
MSEQGLHDVFARLDLLEKRIAAVEADAALLFARRSRPPSVQKGTRRIARTPKWFDARDPRDVIEGS